MWLQNVTSAVCSKHTLNFFPLKLKKVTERISGSFVKFVRCFNGLQKYWCATLYQNGAPKKPMGTSLVLPMFHIEHMYDLPSSFPLRSGISKPVLPNGGKLRSVGKVRPLVLSSDSWYICLCIGCRCQFNPNRWMAERQKGIASLKVFF